MTTLQNSMNIQFDTVGHTVVLKTSVVMMNTDSKIYMYNYVNVFSINGIFT